MKANTTHTVNTTSTALQQQLLRERQEKILLQQAHTYSADYIDQIDQQSVYPAQHALQDLAHFLEDMPDNGTPGTAVLQQLHRYGSPATTAQTGGRYFGFVNGNVLPTALAARLLADSWDQNAALYAMSPIAATLETVCEQWLRQLFKLPKQTVASFVSGSSTAILCSLAAARYRLLANQGWDVNKQGLAGAPALRIIASQQIHGTVLKAIALLGLGSDAIHWVDTDDQGRIIAEQVPELDANTLLILQAGNVNTGAFDSLDTLCERARAAQSWVHVDGAFGLWAAGAASLSYLTQGMEKAHSWSVDGHKTLNTPYDNGIALCSDPEALVSALQASGAYIQYSAQRDGMLYTPEMSRRARGIELWAALKSLGKTGVDALISGLHQHAVLMAQQLEQASFQCLNEVVFNQVLIRCETEAMTTHVLQFIQQSGECWAGASQWQGETAIRISVCSWATTREDIERTVAIFSEGRQQALLLV